MLLTLDRNVGHVVPIAVTTWFLPHKLKTSFGISGQMLALFSSYLTHRRQRVVVDGVTSEWCAVASGVPEGSVLGPSLFLAFINDIPELLDSNCLLYADDLEVFRTVEAVGDSELLILNTWFPVH